VTTHYDVLGVDASAPHDEIRRAYHHLARLHHPDVQADAGSGDTMAAINAAWWVLGDARRRRAYDADLALAHRPESTDVDGADDGDDEPWWLDDEPAGDEQRPLVLVPAALFVLAVVTFGFGVLILSTVVWAMSVALLAASGLAFAAAPMLTIRQRARARRRSTAS